MFGRAFDLAKMMPLFYRPFGWNGLARTKSRVDVNGVFCLTLCNL